MNRILLLSSDSVVSENFYPCISKERLAQAKRFRFKKDHDAHVLAEVLVRFAILNYREKKAENLTFTKKADGKPFLKEYPDFHFNLSHSGRWIACALGESELGVDIEECLPFDSGEELQIARRFFHPKEQEALRLCPASEERRALFYTFWTLKESYIKYTGKGLKQELDSFYFSLSDDIQLMPETEPRLYFHTFQLENCKLSLCTAKADLPKLQIIQPGELKDAFT